MINSLGLFVTLQDSCNLDCAFCQFPPQQKFRTGNKLDFDKFIKFVSDKSEVDDCKLSIPIGAVSFCGSGEPLLYDRIAEIVEETKKYVPFVSIVTNGVLLTSDIAHKLILAGVDHVVISVTGYKNETYQHFQGSGRKVDNSEQQLNMVKQNVTELVNIKNKLHKSTQIGISYLLNEDSKDDYFEALNYWKNIGVNYVDTRMRQRGYSYKSEDYDDYIKNNSKWWKDGNCCTCFGKVMNIFTDGRISGCNCIEDNKIIGNIYDSSMSEIINSDKFLQMFECVTKDYLRMPDYCKSCDMLRARPILT